MRSRAEAALPALAAVAALLLGATLLWVLTQGLTVFTSEAWRRAQVGQVPLALPDVQLQEANGALLALHDLCGQVMLINFIYTHCPDVCNVLGAESAQVATRMEDLIRTRRAQVMSVSFDSARDDPQQLTRYQAQWDRGHSGWRVFRARDDLGLKSLLSTLGVVVIADGRGGYEHNAAWHVVDQSCRVRQILDLADVQRAEASVRALVAQGPSQ